MQEQPATRASRATGKFIHPWIEENQEKGRERAREQEREQESTELETKLDSAYRDLVEAGATGAVYTATREKHLLFLIFLILFSRDSESDVARIEAEIERVEGLVASIPRELPKKPGGTSRILD